MRSNPKLAAAIKACGGGNFVPRRRFAISHAAINNFAACVRKHGYPAMPAPNFNGGAIFPSSIRTNPAFVRASQSCASLLPAGAPSPLGSAAVEHDRNEFDDLTRLRPARLSAAAM